MEKHEQLAALVALRRNEFSTKYICFSDFQDGYYDLDFVVPWTAGANNLDADLMIVGQDWASEDFLKKHSHPDRRVERREMGQDPRLQTNKNLKRLLHQHFGVHFAETYATDVFVFIKPGNMDAGIPKSDLIYCAKKFTLPQISIVRPRIVLCLGLMTFNAVRLAFELPEMKLGEACTPTAHTTFGSVQIYGVPHTGSWGCMNAGGMDKVSEIWKQLSTRLLFANPAQNRNG